MLWLRVAFLTGLVDALVITKSASSTSQEGCLKGSPHGQSVGSVSNVTITSGKLLRYFLISIPPTYRTEVPTPAILSYHGGNRTAEDQLQLDQLTNPEFNTNSIVIYPQGVDVRVLNMPSCGYQRQDQLTKPRTHGKAFQISRQTTFSSPQTSSTMSRANIVLTLPVFLQLESRTVLDFAISWPVTQ